ncbi:uncharacterized protein [Ambystoma mexicanum]|uniref:uncharacterized protein n=1 Tax=Ambystoma mexicanum TaxID=8296 RepID=UPI0037E87984
MCDKVPDTSYDASAYFPEEEWNHLKQWQKELHRNVMNEIDQALKSLGPIIVSTVFALRVKANEDLYLLDNEACGRRLCVHNCSTGQDAHPWDSDDINKGEKHFILDLPESEGISDIKESVSDCFPDAHTESINPIQEDDALLARDSSASEELNSGNHPIKEDFTSGRTTLVIGMKNSEDRRSMTSPGYIPVTSRAYLEDFLP